VKLPILYYKIKTDKPLKKSQIPYLRGYFLNKYKSEELHNHSGNGFKYTYPKVQYKIFKGNAHLIGIDDGIPVLSNIALKTMELELNHETYKIVDGYIALKKLDFGISDEFKDYKFISPWLALNEKNYNEYKKLDENGKKEKLEKILIGNIIAMSKYLNYTVDKKIKVNFYDYEELKVKYKGNSFIGFYGKFSVNFNIPDLLGIGRKVSKGFGTLKNC
jgi:hypothetical protein